MAKLAAKPDPVKVELPVEQPERKIVQHNVEPLMKSDLEKVGMVFIEDKKAAKQAFDTNKQLDIKRKEVQDEAKKQEQLKDLEMIERDKA